MKIACVGGGIAALAAARLLSRNRHQLTIFEKNESLGGLTSSFKDPNWEWPLERYYHHFFSSDKEIKDLANELGIGQKLIFKTPKTSVFVKGKIYRFDNPQSIFSFPHLGILDKFRTGLVSLALKANPFWRPLEKIPAAHFIQKTMGKNSFDLIWQPLLKSKFDSAASQVPASWFWTRIKKRSFSLGYFEGGNEVLVKALTDELEKNRVEILTGEEVTKISSQDNRLAVWTGRKHPQQFDRIILSASPQSVLKIVSGLSQKEVDILKNLTSLGSLCLVFSLNQSFLDDGTYWLNINDSRFPFVAVVEHTNYIDRKHYGHRPLLYIGGYYPPEHRFFKMSKEEIKNVFLPYLKKINPGYNFKGNLRQDWLFKDSYAQPIIPLNYSRFLPPTVTSIPGLFWASLHHVYPQDRGVNYAIKLGVKIADEIESSK